MNVQVNVASPSIVLEELNIPTFGTSASDKVAPTNPSPVQLDVEKNSR